MELCGECSRLERQFRPAMLIVQRDQKIREGKPDTSTLDLTIQRRDADGKRLEGFSCTTG